MNKTDNNGWTAAHFAAARGHVDVVATLIDLGCTMNKTGNDGQTALYVAAGRGRLPTTDVQHYIMLLLRVMWMLLLNSLTNNNGGTALHVAAARGHVNVVAKLINLGCDMNKTESKGVTALHAAAGMGVMWMLLLNSLNLDVT
jgi:ankyrin repeat protein